MASATCLTAKEIDNRLFKVDALNRFDVNTLKYVDEYLYKKIITNLAEQTVTAQQIFIILYDAFHEFYSVMPKSTKTMMIKFMKKKIVEIIKILIDDDIVIKDTIELWNNFGITLQ